ncbi:MAG: hypothetical protein PGN09_02330 [Sphingomonas fennica]
MSEMPGSFWSAAAAVPAWTRPPAPTGAGFRAMDVSRASAFSPWSDGEPVADMAAADAIEPAFTADQIEMLRADAFAEGFEEGTRTAAMEIAAEREGIVRLAQSLESLRPEAPEALALLLSTTVSRLVKAIVGEVQMDAKLLAERCTAAASLIAEDCAPARLRLAPEDAERLAGAALPVELVADPAVRPGAIVMETAAGWIEDGPEVRLERLRRTLDRMGA